MAEHMPGAVSIFADALYKGDKAKLFAAMKDGLKVDDVLAKVFEELARRIDPKAWEAFTQSSRFQQGEFARQWEKTVGLFSKSGMEDGMSTFFRKLTEVLQKLEPLVPALGKSFEFLSYAITAPIELLGTLSDVVTNLPPGVDKFAFAITGLGLAFITLNTGIGRFLLKASLLLASAAAISDAIQAVQGKPSELKDNWNKGNYGEVATQAGIMAAPLLLLKSVRGAIGSGASSALNWGKGLFSLGRGVTPAIAGLTTAELAAGPGAFARFGIPGLLAGATAGTAWYANKLAPEMGYSNFLSSFDPRNGLSQSTLFALGYNNQNSGSSSSQMIQKNEGFIFNFPTNDPQAAYDFFNQKMNETLIQIPTRAQ